jgi:CBS domain-containing protein
MSPRAAWRLESLGFSEVYDYVAGEADWLAMGRPSEGREVGQRRAWPPARRDVPTCGVRELLGEVRQRVQGTGGEACIVVNAERVVLGRVRGAAWNGPDDATVEDVMEAGPTTVRPNEPLAALTERMQKHGTRSVLVTTSDGRLVGVLERGDAERVLGQDA